MWRWVGLAFLFGFLAAAGILVARKLPELRADALRKSLAGGYRLYDSATEVPVGNSSEHIFLLRNGLFEEFFFAPVAGVDAGVVEGNWRLAGNRLILGPTLMDGETQSELDKDVTQGAITKSTRAKYGVLFETRDFEVEAGKIVALRFENDPIDGPNSGAGRHLVFLHDGRK